MSKDTSGLRSAWLVYPPNEHATDCTDMDDTQFEQFIRAQNETN